MEEGGVPSNEELQIRADKFSRFEDLAKSHENFKSHNMRKSVPTWRIMSAIVGRINGNRDWWDLESTRDYQSRYLGRPGGETFLTEVLPMPKKAISEWPYENLLGTPNEYLETVQDSRLQLLRNDYSESSPKPEYIFCYGKEFWGKHVSVFDGINFESELEGSVQWGIYESSVVIQTKMFGYGWHGFNEEFVNNVCELALSKRSA
jgi:hypothetical protein